MMIPRGESQNVVEEWIAVVLQLRRSLRLGIVKVCSGEQLARRVLANVFMWLKMPQVRLVVQMMFPWLPSNTDTWERPRCRSEPDRVAEVPLSGLDIDAHMLMRHVIKKAGPLLEIPYTSTYLKLWGPCESVSSNKDVELVAQAAAAMLDS